MCAKTTTSTDVRFWRHWQSGHLLHLTWHIVTTESDYIHSLHSNVSRERIKKIETDFTLQSVRGDANGRRMYYTPHHFAFAWASKVGHGRFVTSFKAGSSRRPVLKLHNVSLKLHSCIASDIVPPSNRLRAKDGRQTESHDSWHVSYRVGCRERRTSLRRSPKLRSRKRTWQNSRRSIADSLLTRGEPLIEMLAADGPPSLTKEQKKHRVVCVSVHQLRLWVLFFSKYVTLIISYSYLIQYMTSLSDVNILMVTQGVEGEVNDT